MFNPLMLFIYYYICGIITTMLIVNVYIRYSSKKLKGHLDENDNFFIILSSFLWPATILAGIGVFIITQIHSLINKAAIYIINSFVDTPK